MQTERFLKAEVRPEHMLTGPKEEEQEVLASYCRCYPLQDVQNVFEVISEDITCILDLLKIKFIVSKFEFYVLTHSH